MLEIVYSSHKNSKIIIHQFPVFFDKNFLYWCENIQNCTVFPFKSNETKWYYFKCIAGQFFWTECRSESDIFKILLALFIVQYNYKPFQTSFQITFGFLVEAVRTHNSIAARAGATWVKSSRVDQISAVRSGMAPSYLAGSLHMTSEIDTRRCLRSADTATLVVLSTNHCSLGNWAFPVASARAWNSLPPSVRNASSLMSFRRNMKTELFRSSFSD